MLLIGGDCPDAFWVLDERRCHSSEPYAVKFPLGWTLLGPVGPGSSNEQFHGNLIRSRDDLLQLQVEKFWKTDFGDCLAESEVCMSSEDKQALKIMNETVILTGGHYQVGLPWKRRPPSIPNNRSLAESRLRLLKRRLLRDENLHTKYNATMNEYLAKRHAVKISPDELPTDGKTVWYLPHHPVFHPRKPEKARVVFDCAAKYMGTSLNDQLLQGPDLNNHFVGLLMRFREERVAVVADIEFHQVKVDPRDCDALRFMWWSTDDLNQPPEEYKMIVHVFGATSSPSCTSFCLKKTAEDNEGEFSAEVVGTVKRSFYVDDCLKSVRTREDARTLVSELTELLSRRGFHLTKWMSNDREVLASIPHNERTKSVIDLDLDELRVERTLGVQWNVETDEFGFKVVAKEKPSTRRGILSVASSVYDPLGFVAPFTLSVKLILQELCKKKISWNEEIDGEELKRWGEWLADLPRLSEITVKRCYKPAPFSVVSQVQLHHFSDASQYAYDAASYLRLVDADGNVHCSLLIGKSRLAPLKAITIPRLELSAAVASVKLDNMFRRELDLPVENSVFWSDSTSVIQLIRNQTKRFHTFVANRLSVIHDGSSPEQWRYVDSKLNPADDVSRGLTADQLIRNERWLHGPAFLWKSEESWPTRITVPELSDVHPEVKPEVRAFTTLHQNVLNSLIVRYSSWDRLKKAVAWLLRYKRFLLSKLSNRKTGAHQEIMKGEFSAEETISAEREVIANVQQEAFSDHFTQRSKSSSPLYKLFLVTVDGILRVGGRLRNAPVSEDAKHPILLPKRHHVTDLIVRKYHEELAHAGREHVLASIRERFWIVKGRVAVRRVLRECFKCRRRSAPSGEQIMADLPPERLTPDRPPFTFVGIDYFGPIMVKQKRSHVKRYGCLFTCMALRPVHIEIAHSLDTDSFIDAL